MDLKTVKKIVEKYKPIIRKDLKLHLKGLVCVSTYPNAVIAESILLILRRQEALSKQIRAVMNELNKE